MKFYNLEEAPVSSDDLVFKMVPVTSAIALVLFWGVSLVALLAGLKVIDLHLGVKTGAVTLAYINAAWTAVFGLFAFARLRAGLKPSNWLLRSNQTVLLIKYRSSMNWKLPVTDIQVVKLEYSEIAWARKTTEQRTSPGIGSKTNTETLSYLDLSLASETSALADNLSAEQKRVAAAPSHWNDFPVELLSDGIVRIRWTGTHPGLSNALKILGHHITVTDGAAFKSDLASTSNLSADELKTKILKLAGGGDKIAACELAKKALHCSTTEAAQFVENLSSNGS